MRKFICDTCGTQHPESPQPPERCAICEDERQFIGFRGQRWTTLDELRSVRLNRIAEEEPRLFSIWTEPDFAVGQRAFLIQSPGGNVLWDCIPLLDDSTIARIRALGGISAIAISHPHYYTTMLEWSGAFGGVPVYLHESDREWVMRHGETIRFWPGERLPLHDGMTLVRGGGHFEGASMLHWPAGADGRGVLFSGDTIQVVLDRKWVSFMRSYPNLIPLRETKVRAIARSVEDLAFDRIHGAFHPRSVMHEAKKVLARSVERYVKWIRD